MASCEFYMYYDQEFICFSQLSEKIFLSGDKSNTHLLYKIVKATIRKPIIYNLIN